MDRYQVDIARIKELLADHPKGMSITDIAELIGVNRNSVAKYMDILQIQGAVDGYRVGTSKLYFLSSRLPVSSVRKVCTRPLLIVDQHGEVADANIGFLELAGLSRNGIAKTPFESLPISARGATSLSGAFRAALRGNEESVPAIITHHEDPQHPVTIHFTPIVFETGRPGAALIIAEESPSPRHAGQALDAAFSDILALLDDELEYVVRYRPDGTIRFVNETYCRASGKTKEELIGRAFRPLVSEEDAGRIRAHLGALSPENPVATIEFRAVMADGVVRWQRWKDRALFDDHGELTGYQSCGMDITELSVMKQQLRHAEEVLEETVAARTDELRNINRQLYGEIAKRDAHEQSLLLVRAILNSAADAILLLDRTGRVRYANRPAYDLFGVTEKELASLVAPDLLPEYTAVWWNAPHTTTPTVVPGSFRTTMVTGCDDSVPVEILLRPLAGHAGEYLCCFLRVCTGTVPHQ